MNYQQAIDMLDLIVIKHRDVVRQLQTVANGTLRPTKHNMPLLYSDLRCHGFRVLGHGFFSIVVAHKLCNFVVKIGLKVEDSGAAYAAWCRANPGEHVPVIYAMQRRSSVYYVCMKRYTEVPVALRQQEDWLDNLWNYMYYHDDESIAYVADAPPSFLECCEKIRTFFKGVCHFDLHDENIMMDGDTIIITDPMSYTRNKIEARRIESGRLADVNWQDDVLDSVDTMIAEQVHMAHEFIKVLSICVRLPTAKL